MGQKTNPISLRLHIDRHFDSCWYPGHYSEYGQYLHTDLNIREYLKSLFKTLGFHTGRIHVQFYPKKLDIHYFVHPDPLKTKRRRVHTMYQSPSSSLKGLSFLRAVREKQKLFATQPVFTFRESLALQRQKTLHFEQKIRMKKKPTISFLFKEAPKTLSFQETLRNLITSFSKTQKSYALRHAQNEGQKLFVMKGLFTLKSFQQIFQKILECPKGFPQASHLKNHQEFIENSHQITETFFKKADQISQTFEGFEGICRFLSLPQLFKNHEWVTLDFFDKNVSEQILQEYSEFFVKSYQPLTSLSSRLHDQKFMFLKGKNLKHIEKMIDHTFGSQTTLIPYKIQSRTRSASFLCQTAIEQFQKNLSFRHIYKGLLKDIQSDPHVQGIRFVCSGRFGGVEMARVESRKYGQTSLHVFSSHIDYAHGHAITSSGLLGVKIWISYRPMTIHSSSWMNKWSFTKPQEAHGQHSERLHE
jgi:ribosomal protein S3